MNEELDIKQILKYCYQRKRVLITIIIASILLGILYTFFIKQPTYKITAKILIDKAEASVEQVINSKDLEQDNIKTEFDKTSKIITVITETTENEEGINVTNNYIEKMKIKLQETYDIKTFKIIENPEFPQQASNINYIKDILIALCVGIIIDIVYIIISLNFIGLTNIFEIEQNLKVKALGSVSLDKTKNKNLDIAKEEKIQYQIKRIQTNLILNKENKNPQTILLTATKKGEGTSYITVNLANQYSKLNSKILIIDANTKNKKLTNTMAEENKGLTDILVENNVNDIEKLIQKTKIKNVFILPIGKEIIGEEIFLTETIDNIIENAKKKYDTILIDSSSINENVIPIRLANITDTTILISEAGKAGKEDIIKAKTEIENVGGNIAGIVLNKSIYE